MDNHPWLTTSQANASLLTRMNHTEIRCFSPKHQIRGHSCDHAWRVWDGQRGGEQRTCAHVFGIAQMHQIRWNECDHTCPYPLYWRGGEEERHRPAGTYWNCLWELECLFFLISVSCLVVCVFCFCSFVFCFMFICCDVGHFLLLRWAFTFFHHHHHRRNFSCIIQHYINPVCGCNCESITSNLQESMRPYICE